MRKINSVWLVIVLAMLCSCSIAQTAQPTATPSASVTSSPQFISEQKAIELVGPNCGSPHLRPLQPPSNIRAQLMSMNKAEEYIGMHINCQCSDPTNVTVWIVEMDGIWQLVGGPAPLPTATGQIATSTPAPTLTFNTCYTIINAATGNLVQSGSRKK